MATEPERPGGNTSEEDDEDFDSDAALASAAGESSGSDADDGARRPDGSVAEQAAPARPATSPQIRSSPELWGVPTGPGGHFTPLSMLMLQTSGAAADLAELEHIDDSVLDLADLQEFVVSSPTR